MKKIAYISGNRADFGLMTPILKAVQKSKNTEIIDVPKGNPHTGYINAEEMYNDEIKTFLGAVYGRAPYPYTFEEDLRNLKTLYKLESGGGEI